MNEDTQRFLGELCDELQGIANKDSIVAEYETHIYELLSAVDTPEDKVYDTLIEQLGTPTDIAKVWKQETGMTPRKTQWLFVLLNMAIFILGTVLLICLHIFGWQWLERIWRTIFQMPVIFIVLYMVFWALLGYEMGKEFGHRGKRLLQRTFFIAMIPNILLLYMILFTLIPNEWVDNYVSVSYIFICIGCTVLLYPVTFLGYRWGRKVSI